MLTLSQAARRVLLTCALCASAVASPKDALPLALRGINRDRLSGGLFAALEAAGGFGPRPPSRARLLAGSRDLSKGLPPAVLDARVGVNIRLGDDPPALPASQLGQAEPHLCRSVANPDVLLATFQDGRFSADGGALDCGYAVSRDGGLTWSRALIPRLTTASGGTYLRATDPVAAIGPQGDFFLNTLAALDSVFDRAAIVVNRSTDNGATWSAPTVVYQTTDPRISPDKNWLAVNDFAGAPNLGRLVVTWTSFTSTANGTPTGNNIVAAVSDDRGATWSAPVAITPSGADYQGSQPVFLPDGSLVVIYATFLNPSLESVFSIDCKRSEDGGRTFPATATAAAALVVGWDDPSIRDGVALPSATVARQSGEIYVGYTAIVGGSPRVLMTKSSDRGSTWTAPVVASDQPAGISVMNPAIAVTPDGRAVSIVFMDRRNAREGRDVVDHYVAQSFDGGATWQPNLRLTDVSSDLRLATPTSRGYMLGDYLAVAPSLAGDQPCVAIWCDTRTGDADPFTVRFSPVAAQTFEAWRTARFTRAELADPRRTGAAADFDDDGVSNYIEFDAGTDPRVVESGETIIVSRPDADTLDVASAGRADLIRTQFSATELQATLPGLSNPGVTPGSPALPLASGTAKAPDVALRPGLAWRTARYSGVRAKAISVTQRAASVEPPTTTPPAPGLELATTRESVVNGTDARLVNLATRGPVRGGARNLIAGFVLDGPKSILVRAAGPTLAQFGVSGTLADPQLLLTSTDPAATATLANDNWAPAGGAMSELFARVGAFPFAAASLDAALVANLDRRSYTALVSGAATGTGVALVEIYDADAITRPPSGPKLVNLSTRAEAGTGDSALIVGFSLAGTQPRRLLIRAVGPSLAAFGLDGVLADPLLTLFRGNQAIAVNDDWEISRSSAAIAATAQRVGAFALTAASLDAALLLTLVPGNYTAVVTGANGTTGLALIEVYDAD